jgi:tetratricopeptide (TPR) repeat protein
MGARRGSGSDLPRAPLQMVHPAALPGAAVPGAEIVAELESGEGVVLCSLFRAALAWSNDPAGSISELAEVEEHALARLDDGDCWPAAALIAAQLAGGRVDRVQVAQACFCMAEWALERNAGATALAFTLLAALVCPRHPRYAWAAGRMLRGHGRTREAEFWLERSQRVAVWTGDAVAHSKALGSLGVLAYVAGNYGKAERTLVEALSVAARNGLREHEGAVLHDLMVMEIERQDFPRAEAYGIRAVEKYLPGHARLPALAHDIGFLWMEQGNFARALPVLRSVVAHLADPAERFQSYAAAARAAGAVGDEAEFTTAWTGAQECAAIVGLDRLRAAALLDLGRGAASLGRWDTAIETLGRAVAIAEQRAESDVRLKAESALDSARKRVGADKHARSLSRRGSPADQVAHEVILALAPALHGSVLVAGPE